MFLLAKLIKVGMFDAIMGISMRFSSESVGEGHPDKVADYISDSILDACLKQDPASRVACETLVKSNMVTVAGEITTEAKFDYNAVIREAIREIGYESAEDDPVFHADDVFINNYLTRQSPDIAQGVDAKSAEGKDTDEQGAGDQGIMFGYACNETPELMPAAIMFAHRILRKLADLRKAKAVDWLRPDAKSQVCIAYEDGKITHIDNVVVSTQHKEHVSHEEIYDFIVNKVIKEVLPAELLNGTTQYLINPTGKFVIGGPEGDAGLTGRKIIVDTYGGWGRHGGGAFSGKDPSKVDRSAAYMCRWVAKNVVAAGLAEICELQVAYAIGYPHPTSIHIETFDTGNYPDARIIEAIRKVFDFKPAEINRQLDLLRPIYKASTHYGHFGKPDLPWEQLNKVDELKAAIEA